LSIPSTIDLGQHVQFLHVSLKASTPVRLRRIRDRERDTESGSLARLAISISKSVMADILVSAALTKIVWINVPMVPAVNQMTQNWINRCILLILRMVSSKSRSTTRPMGKSESAELLIGDNSSFRSVAYSEFKVVFTHTISSKNCDHFYSKNSRTSTTKGNSLNACTIIQSLAYSLLVMLYATSITKKI